MIPLVALMVIALVGGIGLAYHYGSWTLFYMTLVLFTIFAELTLVCCEIRLSAIMPNQKKRRLGVFAGGNCAILAMDVFLVSVSLQIKHDSISYLYNGLGMIVFLLLVALIVFLRVKRKKVTTDTTDIAIMA